MDDIRGSVRLRDPIMKVRYHAAQLVSVTAIIAQMLRTNHSIVVFCCLATQGPHRLSCSELPNCPCAWNYACP